MPEWVGEGGLLLLLLLVLLLGEGNVSDPNVVLLTVAAKVTPVGGLVGAVRAGERLVPRVRAYVALQQVLPRRLVRAQWASKSPNSISYPQVP